MAGLNLTEDTRYVLCHLTRSMKSMTLQAFTVLMDWVKKQRPGSCKKSVNIICADFVGISRNEFCEIVIGLNAELTTQNKTMHFHNKDLSQSFSVVSRLHGISSLDVCTVDDLQNKLFVCLQIFIPLTLFQLFSTVPLS